MTRVGVIPQTRVNLSLITVYPPTLTLAICCVGAGSAGGGPRAPVTCGGGGPPCLAARAPAQAARPGMAMTGARKPGLYLICSRKSHTIALMQCRDAAKGGTTLVLPPCLPPPSSPCLPRPLPPSPPPQYRSLRGHYGHTYQGKTAPLPPPGGPAGAESGEAEGGA